MSNDVPVLSAPPSLCFACPKCGAKFHPRTHHSRQISEDFDEQRFRCPKCGTEFARRRERETLYALGIPAAPIRGRKVIYKLKR